MELLVGIAVKCVCGAQVEKHHHGQHVGPRVMWVK